MSDAVPDTKAKSKSDRTRAREFAVQALYQVLIGKNPPAAVDAFTRELTGFHKCNAEHYAALLFGCSEHMADLDAQIASALDRPMHEISPIEHVIMWVGVYEYLHCQDVPWRVVLNECIELTKSFGGTDGHKYVNGVLHKLAQTLREREVADDKPSRKPQTAPRQARGERGFN